MTPLMMTAPMTAIGTLRRGFWVSSASGAAASKPPKARTARLKVSSTSVECPDGQLNGVAGQPVVAAPDQDGDAHDQQQDDLERVQRDSHPDAEPQAHHHRRDHEHAVGDRDDLGQAPDMRIAEYVLDDVTADEYVNAAEGDDVAEDGDHADRDRHLGADGASDVGDERSGARVNAGELRQAARRGHHAHHRYQEDQRCRGAGQADHQPGGEEEVERRRDLRHARHDDAEQAELAVLQGWPGRGGFGDGGHG